MFFCNWPTFWAKLSSLPVTSQLISFPRIIEMSPRGPNVATPHALLHRFQAHGQVADTVRTCDLSKTCCRDGCGSYWQLKLSLGQNPGWKLWPHSGFPSTADKLSPQPKRTWSALASDAMRLMSLTALRAAISTEYFSCRMSLANFWVSSWSKVIEQTPG